MKTIKKVEITTEYVEFIPNELEDNKIYISEKYKVSVHGCLCGCGNITALPLSSNGWNLIKEKDNKISFTPSIGNYNFPCKSHYIITNNIANSV
jgi:Family of unknown function (DUF6527)